MTEFQELLSFSKDIHSKSEDSFIFMLAWYSARSENLGGKQKCGGVIPPGLTDLPTSGGACTPPAPLGPPSLSYT